MNLAIFRKQATAAYTATDTRGTILQVAPPSLTAFFAVVTALVVTALALGLFARVQIPVEGRGTIHPDAPPVRAHDRRVTVEIDLASGTANARVAAPSDGREDDALPPGTKLVGSLALPETRRSEIAVGRSVRLALDAYPVDRFGTGRGKILRIAHGEKDDAMRVDVEVEALPRGVDHAESGMTFTGYVETEKVRLVSLLLP